MRCYRITRAPYVGDVTGEGSRLYGGRWSPVGLPAIYTSEHPALAAWEILVHIGPKCLGEAPLEHHLVALDVPEASSITRIPHVPHEPVDIGQEWLQSGESLMLSVPSVVIPEAHNFIVNPSHPDMNKVNVEDLGVFII